MKKFPAAKFIIMMILLAALIILYAAAGMLFDDKINDALIKSALKFQKKQPSDKIVIIAADDKSVLKYDWPRRRDKFAEIFDYLENTAHAKVILFDNLVIFPDTYNKENDEKFYEAVSKSSSLINTNILFNSNIIEDVIPAEYEDIFAGKTNVTIKDERAEKKDYSYKSALKLPESFLKSVKYLAVSMFPVSNDGFVRTYIPVFMYNNKFYPSAALSAYALYTGINNFVINDRYLCPADNCRKLKMPVYFKKIKDSAGNAAFAPLAYYSWRNPLNKYYSHKSFSAIDVLEGKVSADEFKDKIVIISLNAPAAKSNGTHSTPVLNEHAGADLHAVMIDSMLANSFKTEQDKNFAPMLTIVFCFFILRGFKKFKPNLIFTALLAVLYVIYYFYSYMLGIYTVLVPPIAAMFAACVFKTLYYALTADKTAEAAKRALGKYVSKDVMKNIIENFDKLKLGGIRTTATIFFIDIRNFTKISEELPPQELTAILNEYFSAVEPVIAKYRGIVNKYIGDGLLAVFGEPVQTKDHAKNAVLCGIEIIQRMQLLRERFEKENKPVINIGIGVNTGEVFAGNIGTDERLEYTVIGDNVNLASRIEAYNQILKTQFLISEYTYEYVKDIVEVVKLSRVNIKGKSKPIDIYEVLRLKNDKFA